MNKHSVLAYLTNMVRDAQFGADNAIDMTDHDKFVKIMDFILNIISGEDGHKVPEKEQESKGYMAKIRDCEMPTSGTYEGEFDD